MVTLIATPVFETEASKSEFQRFVCVVISDRRRHRFQSATREKNSKGVTLSEKCEQRRMSSEEVSRCSNSLLCHQPLIGYMSLKRTAFFHDLLD